MAKFLHTEYTEEDIRKLIYVVNNYTPLAINPPEKPKTPVAASAGANVAQNAAAPAGANAASPAPEDFVKPGPNLSQAEQKLSEMCAKIYMFEGLIGADVLKLVRNARIVQFDKAKKVFSAGDSGSECYVVLSGSVDILLPVEGAEPIKLATLTPPKVFGETAFASRAKARTFTALAADNSSVIRFDINEDAIGDTTMHLFLQLYLNVSSEFAVKLEKANLIV
ncbi:MAG: cyclic nucleotide-binding domain-containing protein [Helicobacteraceae bacterium]|jgi:hypothetical protein|nr:cyclic nucleotide-binding domain-containing protein [Helicobacteraceae bacterium]